MTACFEKKKHSSTELKECRNSRLFVEGKDAFFIIWNQETDKIASTLQDGKVIMYLIFLSFYICAFSKRTMLFLSLLFFRSSSPR